MKRTKKIILSAIATWMLIIVCSVSSYAFSPDGVTIYPDTGAVIGSSDGIDVIYLWDERHLTIDTNFSDTWLRYSFDNKSWMYALPDPVQEGDPTWEIDLSAVSEKKEAKIYFYSANLSQRTIILAKTTANTIKGVYSGINNSANNVSGHAVNLTGLPTSFSPRPDGKTLTYFYKTYTNAMWKEGFDPTIPVSQLEPNGGTVYLRARASLDRIDSTTMRLNRTKMITVKVPKAKTAPSAKFSGTSGYLSGFKHTTMEIRVDDGQSRATDLSAYSSRFTPSVNDPGWYKADSSVIHASELNTATSAYIYFRTAATAKAPASKEKMLPAGGFAQAPSIAVNNSTDSSVNISLSYVNETIIVDALKKYEYTIVYDTKKIDNKTKWTALSKAITSIASIKPSTNSTIYFRTKGVNESKTTQLMLPSPITSFNMDPRPTLASLTYDKNTFVVANANTGTAIEYVTDKTKWADSSAVKQKLTTDADYGKFSVSDLLITSGSVSLYLRIPASNNEQRLPSVTKTLTLPSPTLHQEVSTALGNMFDTVVPKAGDAILTSFPSLATGLNRAFTNSNNASSIPINIGFQTKSTSSPVGLMTSKMTTGANGEGQIDLSLVMYTGSLKSANILSGDHIYSAAGISIDQVVTREIMLGILNVAASKGTMSTDAFPKWFTYGLAQAAAGATEGWTSQMTTTSLDGFKKDLTSNFGKGTNEDKYATGYYADLFLGYLAAGKTIGDLENISASDFNTSVKSGLDKILTEIIVNGKSLDDAILTTTTGKAVAFASTEDMIKKCKDTAAEDFLTFCKKVKTLKTYAGVGSICAPSLSTTSVSLLSGYNENSRVVFDKTALWGLNVMKRLYVGGGKTTVN